MGNISFQFASMDSINKQGVTSIGMDAFLLSFQMELKQVKKVYMRIAYINYPGAALQTAQHSVFNLISAEY